MPSGPHIAFLGIGLMGASQACSALPAGFPLTAWNRSLLENKRRNDTRPASRPE